MHQVKTVSEQLRYEWVKVLCKITLITKITHKIQKYSVAFYQLDFYIPCSFEILFNNQFLVISRIQVTNMNNTKLFFEHH